jgi:hypothetical protein
MKNRLWKGEAVGREAYPIKTARPKAAAQAEIPPRKDLSKGYLFTFPTSSMIFLAVYSF